MVRIKRAEVIQGSTVKLELTNGTTVERELTPLLVDPLYAPLKEDPSLFGLVTVVDGTLQWPNGLDLDPDMVIWGGPPPADQVRRTG